MTPRESGEATAAGGGTEAGPATDSGAPRPAATPDAANPRGGHPQAREPRPSFSTAERQRAANLFWNAAHDYSTPPGHLFIDADGKALPYENTAAGLVRKWFDAERLHALAAAWKDDYRADALDRLLWLAFSEAACAREDPTRPALAGLHAAFLDSLDEEGKAVRAVLPDTGQLAAMPQAALENRVLELAKRRYGFDGRVVRPARATLHLGVGVAPRLGTRGAGRSGLPLFAQPRSHRGARDGGGRASLARRRDERRRERAAAERRDIEACFGPSTLTDAQLRKLEERICTGNHAGCRVWVTDGGRLPEGAGSRQGRELAASARAQVERTREFFRGNRRLCEDAARNLAFQLRDRIHAERSIWERRATHGTLDPAHAWRADAADDPRIFRRRSDPDELGLSVAILLDGSGSRSDDAPAIATQAWVLAEGLRRAGARVSTCSFSSFGSFTVFRRLDGTAADAAGGPAVLRYFAAGMNRDGLAIRAAGDYLARTQGNRKLLLVLTDGAPMDERPFPQGSAGAAVGEYVGKPAVRDAADEVRALSSRGIFAAGIFNGEDARLADARTVFGAKLVRIRQLQRLADAAGALVALSLEG